MAQSKFLDSGESLEKITPDLKGKPILVPLTGSVSFKTTFSDFTSGSSWYL